MAKPRPILTCARRPTAPTPAADPRARHLAEMVVGLTGCDPLVADASVRAAVAALPDLDPLEIVSRAITAIQSRERPRRAPSRERTAEVVVDLRAERAEMHLDLTAGEDVTEGG